jgi:hypothetical protein
MSSLTPSGNFSNSLNRVRHVLEAISALIERAQDTLLQRCNAPIRVRMYSPGLLRWTIVETIQPGFIGFKSRVLRLISVPGFGTHSHQGL